MFVGVLVGALGFSSPAMASVLGVIIQLPGATAPTNLTVGVDDTLGANAVADLTGINPTLDNILGVTNVPGGVTQTTTTLTQLLNGLKTGAAVAAPVVSALATEAAGTAITNLQTRAQNTAAAALALDPAGVTEQTQGILTDLQGQALGEVAGLLPLALTTGLQVAQSIVTPVCSLTAIPGMFLPGVGLDTTRTYITALPLIQQTDAATNQLLRDTYSKVYDDTLASVNNIPNVGPIASALLTLLKYNWTSTYTPPGSSTPIVTETKALMNVPTPIDVDHDGLFDLCGTTSFALTGSGTSITGIKFTQTITKMPLAKPVLPVDITGGLLNVINFGYDTTESTVPIVYTTSATLDTANSAKLNIDDNFAVHRGTNLTIPPIILKDLNLTNGTLLPTIPPLFTPAPKPIVTQKVCIGACSGLSINYRFENVPTATHVDAPLASAGVNVNYTGAQTSDSFGYKFAVGSSLSLGTAVGTDRPAVGSTPARVFSAPTAATSCLSISDGTCSPNAASGDSISSGFTASSPTSLDQDVQIGGTNSPNNCTAIASLGVGVRINDTTAFNTSAKKGSATVGAGHFAIDTGNDEVDGCYAPGSTLALAGAPVVTLPSGFKAANRQATYHWTTKSLGLQIDQTVPDTKTGTITCPAGTAANVNPVFPTGTLDLAPVICFLPTTAGTVTIGGSPTVDSTLTANLAGWGPGAPNAPSFTYQWNKCAADGSNCQPIPGATNATYTLQYGAETGPPPVEPTDWHHKFTVTVKGHNLDGDAQVTSDKTPLVELPPPPVNTVAPVLGSNRHVGDATTLSSLGTWNPGATSYKYQWQRCLDSMGLMCTDIAGANGTATSAAGVSYVLTTADKARYIRVSVTGHNHGGDSALPAYSNIGYVPGDPVNTGNPPGIKNGPANAVGASVATGDTLTASTTTNDWSDTNAPFTYQWQRCDAGGNNCVDIGGATSSQYTVQHPSDDGSTLRVKVTGHGLNGTGDAYSGTTGVVLFNDLSAKPVTQIPDGTVNATVAGSGSTTYVGGSFDTVGAPTGGSGLVDDGLKAGSDVTGKTVKLASATAGAANGGVLATVPDGTGGYFLGGSFTQVKGIPCPGLAHLVSDGSVDQTYCYSGLNGTVRALTRVSNGTSKVLAVGGSFTFGGHSNLMFIDPAAPASPVYLGGGDPNGVVKTLTSNLTNTVFLGGQFSQAGGTSAGLVAGASLTWTGTQLSSVARNGWTLGVCQGALTGTSACTEPTATVNTLSWLSSSVVLVGGHFDRTYAVVAGTPSTTTRNNAALVADSAYSLLGWNPNIAGGAATVNAIAPQPVNGISNIPVYIGGDFTSIAGTAIKNLGEFGSSFVGGNAALTNTSNNAGPPMATWLPNPNGPVTSLAWAGTTSSSTLIVGGGFTTIDTRPNTSTPFTTLVRHRLAKINIAGSTSTTLPVVDASWDPNAGRTVRTVSRDATLGTVTVGGDFLVLGGQTRNNLAEFDPNTGVTSWNPSADGTVNALSFLGGTVYAGGSFANVGGSARPNLAAINGSTGAVTGWNAAGANGTVNAIDTQGGVVYVGGQFTSLAGAPRTNLGGVDASSGAVLAGWTPNPDGPVLSVRRSGGTDVYVGGSFANIGGQARNNVAAIGSDGNATAFDPNANGAVRSIVVNLGDVYLGGDFTQVGGQGRAHVAVTDAVSGAVGGWNPGVDGNVNALFLVGSQLFVGGQFTNAGGAARKNLANLDTGSDNALAFNAAPNDVVNAISRTSGGSIAVGGKFTIISGQAAPGLGFYGG
ncbi:hypothetical protein EFL95_19005 [Nocardioides marmorisolisilvae]|uniref:Uncharacterized protein n=1 Tax=Nocardioides marmorisolisilvae TaxID=1542737 RepID=A0A3N0DIK9_9ACTN|nr:hypothetical protein EFL95_19005 [Nocardioides marmorisolisilvae]